MPEAILTREDAQEWVNKIRRDNGGVSLADEAGMRKDYPEVWEVLQSVRRKLGSAVKTLATNLRSKDTQYLYELIQNADDNQYTQAEANFEDPFISFSLYPDRLVIDSNEDGFNAENVMAICNIGQSTKTAARGYIGEKEIGFKSVFKIAHHVHIQSGVFSFSFQHAHDSDDEGLGMVTPLTEPYEDLPEDVRTRMTLRLLSNLDHCRRAEELSRIPDTLLLFVRNLRSIQVFIYPETGNHTQIVYSCDKDPVEGLETVEKCSRSNDGEYVVEKRHFRVTRRTIKELPNDASRSNDNQADVVLAFPVNEAGDEVCLQKQNVFAYLPIRSVGFNFLIQSDFITQANRKDILHSPRNKALLSGVAETFRDAILRFCTDKKLQYQWMRYLPDGSVTDEFWGELKPQIEALLKETPVLRSWSGRLHYPGQLRFVGKSSQDKYGEPLLADLPNEGYLAPGYTYDDFKLLKGLGTRSLYMVDFLNRLEADLERSDSKMKNTATENDWHSRVANILCKCLPESTQRVRSLPLIPLATTRQPLSSIPASPNWVSVTSNGVKQPLFFPTSGQSNIPTDLGYQLVDGDAVMNKDRKNLFAHLGVINCGSKSVITAIYRKHAAREVANVSNSVPHVEFLFSNLPAGSRLDEAFYMFTEGGNVVNVRSERVYLPGLDTAYNAKSVLHAHSPRYPGAKFIHPLYLESIPGTSQSHGMSFSVWLEEVADVKRIPQIHQSSNDQPSEELKYILEHRSDILLELLRANWPQYAAVITDSIEDFLKQSEVPSLDGAMVQLQRSYMPLQKLTGISQSFEVFKAPLFVRTPSTVQDEEEESWMFLSRFGVRFVDDVDFYMNLLESMHQYGPEEPIFRVYKTIMKKCITEEDCSTVRKLFKKGENVYLPRSQRQPNGWVFFEDCVWDGPDWLVVRVRLSVVPEYRDLKHLFKTVLGLRDVMWHDALDELSRMKLSRATDYYKVCQIYYFLQHNFDKNSSYDRLRSRFQNDNLIFVSSRKAWFPPSTCLWADHRTRISGRISIGKTYAPMREFFCQMLQVQEPNLQMHIQALKQLSEEKPPSILRIKESISSISAMGPDSSDLMSLRFANILPVRLPSGDVKLTNASVDFAIVDCKEYGEAFKDRVATLDLSFNEVHACRPFLLALNLSHRFMSAAVKQETTAQGGLLDHNLTDALREKAHAIFRICTHFNCATTQEGDQNVFDLFCCATVHVSEKISKSLSLTQNLQVFTADGRDILHLEQSAGQLKLYVPPDERDQELCYLQHLPNRILRFLSISNSSAETELVKVLASSNLTIANAILDDAGIIGLVNSRTAKGDRTEVDHIVWLSEAQPSSSSPVGQDAVSTLAESEGTLRADDEKLSNSSPAFFPPRPVPSAHSESIGHSATVPDDLHGNDFDNSNSSTISDSELSFVSCVESASPDWADKFLRVSRDSGNLGTGRVQFQEYLEFDKFTSQFAHHPCIVFQSSLRRFSLEELRLHDYCTGLK